MILLTEVIISLLLDHLCHYTLCQLNIHSEDMLQAAQIFVVRS